MSCDDQEIPTFQRESTEFLALDVRKDGTVVTAADFTVCVTPVDDRPADDAWVAATELDGKAGVMVHGPSIGPGMFKAWAKVTSTPETVVLDCGLFRVA